MDVKEVIDEKEINDIYFIDDDENIDKENKYLAFEISNEVFTISIKDVIEIIEIQNITYIPDMPQFVKGIINLRGKIFPVIDLRLRFNINSWEYDNRSCIVIVKIDEISAGFLVDRVLEVIDIPESNISPPPQFKTESGHDKYIIGIGKIGNEVKIILDSSKIIDVDGLSKIKNNIK